MVEDIELQPLLKKRKSNYLHKYQVGKERSSAVAKLVRHDGPVIAALASSGQSGFFRQFIYRNPPFALTAFHHQAINTAYPKSRPRTINKRKKHCRFYIQRPRFKKFRNYSKSRKIVVSRIIKEFDGSSTPTIGLLTSLDQRAGIDKFIISTELL